MDPVSEAKAVAMGRDFGRAAADCIAAHRDVTALAGSPAQYSEEKYRTHLARLLEEMRKAGVPPAVVGAFKRAAEDEVRVCLAMHDWLKDPPSAGESLH